MRTALAFVCGALTGLLAFVALWTALEANKYDRLGVVVAVIAVGAFSQWLAGYVFNVFKPRVKRATRASE